MSLCRFVWTCGTVTVRNPFADRRGSSAELRGIRCAHLAASTARQTEEASFVGRLSARRREFSAYSTLRVSMGSMLAARRAGT
jgi:hypothetical protein